MPNDHINSDNNPSQNYNTTDMMQVDTLVGASSPASTENSIHHATVRAADVFALPPAEVCGKCAVVDGTAYRILKSLIDPKELRSKGHTVRLFCGVSAKDDNRVALKFSRARVGAKICDEDPFSEPQIMKDLGAWHGSACSDLTKSSDYVVTMHGWNTDVDEKKEWRYCTLVLDYCNAGDLFSFISESRGLNVSAWSPNNNNVEVAMAVVGLQMLRSAHFLHSKGYAHLDISLENVLVDEEPVGSVEGLSSPRARFGDFGMAHTFDEKTGKTSIGNRRVGKPNYSSPELINANGGEFNAPLADVYAIGVSLFIMLTGYNPYGKASRTDMAFRQVTTKGSKGVSRVAKAYGHEASNEVCDLIGRMLAAEKDRIGVNEAIKHPFFTKCFGSLDNEELSDTSPSGFIMATGLGA